MVHGRGDSKLAAFRGVDQDRTTSGLERELGGERVRQDLRGAGVAAPGAADGLVGDQLRLHDDVHGVTDCFDLVQDRRERSMFEGHHPGRTHLDAMVRRRLPVHGARQGARPQVEQALVVMELPVTDVEWLVVNEQPDDLSVRDVYQRLAGLGVAERGLGIGEGDLFVHGVEVGAGDLVRLALVEVRAPADVAVGQREDRLCLCELLHVEAGLANRPRLYGEARVSDQFISSARSLTTMSAPCCLRASACPARSTPTTRPKRPALPASTPASASSYTAAFSAFVSSSSAA